MERRIVHYMLFVMTIVIITALILESEGKITGYATKRKATLPADVQFSLTPSTSPSGTVFQGTFLITNKASPLFEYSIGLWAPCQPDFQEIKTWSSSSKINGRIQFSGVKERRSVSGFYTVVPFTYTQCFYKWSITSPTTGTPQPLLRPRESLQISFNLPSSPEARVGTYSLEFLDQYGYAGKSSIRFNRK